MSRGRAYWVTAPGHGELRDLELAAVGPDQSLLRARCSGVSPGTERLVGRGLVAAESREAMRCAYMGGSLALPVKYGYALVGDVVQGEGAGSRAFVMHPHQDLAVVRSGDLVRLPEAMPPRRATLLPSLETARNAVWDAELRDGEPVLVVGAGPIGLLVAWVLHREHRGPVAVCEQEPGRRAAAAALPWVPEALAPDQVPVGCFAAAFHATAGGQGLQLALDALRFEGRAVDLAWYGSQPVSLQLGTGFHHLRLRILASQVGAVAPSRRATTTCRERLQSTLELLAAHGAPLEALLGESVPFERMPAFMARLYQGLPVPLLPVIDYGAVP